MKPTGNYYPAETGIQDWRVMPWFSRNLAVRSIIGNDTPLSLSMCLCLSVSGSVKNMFCSQMLGIKVINIIFHSINHRANSCTRVIWIHAFRTKCYAAELVCHFLNEQSWELSTFLVKSIIGSGVTSIIFRAWPLMTPPSRDHSVIYFRNLVPVVNRTLDAYK